MTIKALKYQGLGAKAIACVRDAILGEASPKGNQFPAAREFMMVWNAAEMVGLEWLGLVRGHSCHCSFNNDTCGSVRYGAGGPLTPGLNRSLPALHTDMCGSVVRVAKVIT